MKGIVFNLLETLISRDHGEAAWDGLLDEAGLVGAYTSLGSYPDEELSALVGAASARTGLPPDDVVQWFGREALPLLARSHPHFFQPFESTLPFLLTLNDIIHPEVRKLYPGADVPEFDFASPEEGVLVLAYRSDRRLCSFAEGLIQGAAEHYREGVDLSQTECMKRGDPRCILVCRFRKRDQGRSCSASASVASASAGPAWRRRPWPRRPPGSCTT